MTLHLLCVPNLFPVCITRSCDFFCGSCCEWHLAFEILVLRTEIEYRVPGAEPSKSQKTVMCSRSSASVYNLFCRVVPESSVCGCPYSLRCVLGAGRFSYSTGNRVPCQCRARRFVRAKLWARDLPLVLGCVLEPCPVGVPLMISSCLLFFFCLLCCIFHFFLFHISFSFNFLNLFFVKTFSVQCLNQDVSDVCQFSRCHALSSRDLGLGLPYLKLLIALCEPSGWSYKHGIPCLNKQFAPHVLPAK